MKRRQIVIASSLAVLLFVGLTPLAHASTNDFTVNSFDADYKLGQDDPQGTLTVKEQLSVDFLGYNHGIYRAIPKQYNGLPQHIKISKVTFDRSNEQYTTATSNGNEVLKIGDPNTTVTGLHHYEIDYKVDNAVRVNQNGTAELDWNVNGTDWQQPFLHISAVLHVPRSLRGKVTGSSCFTGGIGSKQSSCLVASTDDTKTYTTTRQLQSGETLTFNDAIPAGYFSRSTAREYLKDHQQQIILAAGLPLLALILAGGAWLRHGRDAKRRGTIIPEYGPPAGLKPAEMDVILHNKLGKNAVSATIIDLAIRKYLKIQVSESPGLLGVGKRTTYSFIKLSPPTNDTVVDYETSILNGLFALSNVIDIAGLQRTFSTTLKDVQKSIPKSLAAKRYFRGNPAKAGNIWHIFGVITLASVFFTNSYSGATLAGAISGGLIFLLFGSIMPSRTTQGAAAKDAAEGLKLYLNTAEKDRIAMLQSPDAPYANASTEPIRTVELFEKLLPYAMILGVEKQWARQFESIYTSPPDWYGNNWSTFDAVYLADSLTSSMTAMNGSFAAPASSSSGFSGGAGGGGGGGGGGGW